MAIAAAHQSRSAGADHALDSSSSTFARVLPLGRSLVEQQAPLDAAERNRLLRATGIQPKLKVNEPGDVYEQEADRVAQQVMRMPRAWPGIGTREEPLVQRACKTCEEDRVQRQMMPEEEEEEEEEVVHRMCQDCEEERVQRQAGPAEEEEEEEEVVQRMCDECAEEEKEKDEEDLLQPRGSGGGNGRLQRMCADCAREQQPEEEEEKEAEEEEGRIRTKRKTPPVRRDRLARTDTRGVRSSDLTAGGAALEPSVRAFYESRFGYDLGSVRVHTGDKAERLADTLHARAFTYRNHIWLGSAERVTPSFCFAHELTHVVQQSAPRRVQTNARSERGTGRCRRTSGEIVQRQYYYWVGDKYLNKKKSAGELIQEEVFASSIADRNLYTEVNIPNAARKRRASGAEAEMYVTHGRADLYRAEGGKRIGLYFNPNAEPKHLRQATGTPRAPRVERGEIVGIAEGPREVSVGEVKPAAIGPVDAGKEQVQSYITGIKLARDKTNEWARSQGREDQWNLPDSNVRSFARGVLAINPEHEPGSQGASDYSLVLVPFDPDTERGGKPIYPPLAGRAARRRPGDPQERVWGRLYVNWFGNGVYAYSFHPTNLGDVINRWGLTASQEGAINFAADLQSTVVDPITGAPVEAMISPMRIPPTALSSVRLQARPRIQRAAKEPPRVRDTFPLEQVLAARSRLRTRFATEKNAPPLADSRVLGAMYEAEARSKAQRMGGPEQLPDKNKLTVTLPRTASTKKGRKGADKETLPFSDLYRWAELWTSKPIDILARFRKVFGTTFVTVGTKVRALKERIGNKLKETFDKHAGSKASGTSYGAVAIRAVGRVLKSIGAIIIPQTLRLVVESFVEGVKERFRSLLPLELEPLERAVANGFGEFKTIQEKVAALQTTIDAEINGIIEALGDRLKPVAELISVARDFADSVKWTVRAIQCGTPPGWGCLKLIFSSLTAYIAEKVLSSCSLQREIACALAPLKVIRSEIPLAIAGAIVDRLNAVAGRIHPKLTDLLAKPGEPPPVNCSDVGCEGGRTEVEKAIDRMRDKLQKEYGDFSGDWMMDSLLELSRLSGVEEGEALSAAEIDELTTLLLQHKVTPAELALLVEQTRERVKEGKPLQKATPQELVDAVERLRPETAGGGAGGGATADPNAGGLAGPSAAGGVSGEGGEGGGLATVDAATAKLDEKIGQKLGRTRITVETPDPKAHKAGKDYTVALIGAIDGDPVKRVVDVPVRVTKHTRAKGTGDTVIHYVLKQGVYFEHSVPKVPTFGVEKGTTLKMSVKKPGRKTVKKPRQAE